MRLRLTHTHTHPVVHVEFMFSLPQLGRERVIWARVTEAELQQLQAAVKRPSLQTLKRHTGSQLPVLHPEQLLCTCIKKNPSMYRTAIRSSIIHNFIIFTYSKSKQKDTLNV